MSKFRKEWVYPTALNGVSSNGYKVLKWVKIEATLNAEEDAEEMRLNTQAAGDKSSGLASLEEDAATPGVGQAAATPAVGTPIDIATPPATSVNNPVVPPSVTHPLAQGITIPPEMDAAKPDTKQLDEIMHEEHPNEPTPDVEMGTVSQGTGDVPMSHQQEAGVAVALDERTLN